MSLRVGDRVRVDPEAYELYNDTLLARISPDEVYVVDAAFVCTNCPNNHPVYHLEGTPCTAIFEEENWFVHSTQPQKQKDKPERYLRLVHSKPTQPQ